jgi:hypothetical protein
MKERIKYLILREVVTNGEIGKIQTEVDEIYNISSVMLNRLIKNSESGILDIKEKTQNDMLKIKQMELTTYKKLYDLLIMRIPS